VQPVGEPLQMAGQQAGGASGLAAHFWNNDAVDVSDSVVDPGLDTVDQFHGAAAEAIFWCCVSLHGLVPTFSLLAAKRRVNALYAGRAGKVPRTAMVATFARLAPDGAELLSGVFDPRLGRPFSHFNRRIGIDEGR
jgi:hypothetical protein